MSSLDNAIKRLVHITRAMRGGGQWSDHRLVRSIVALELCPPHRRQAVGRRRLDLTKLCVEENQLRIQKSMSEGLQKANLETAPASTESKWTTIMEITYKATLGYVSSKHQDWFDDQDTEAQTLLNDMHSTHLAWISDKNNAAKKSAYTRSRWKAQSQFREMKNHWWDSKAAELQDAAD